METIKDLTDAKEIAEHTARILLSASQYPEFGTGSVPVTVAAKALGKDITWVQSGITYGWLPIGVATKGKEHVKTKQLANAPGRTNYYISPKLLWELTGYVWRGEEN